MPDRRDALVAAVATYNRAHKPLPNSTVRLLETMFASDDVCQLSLDALEDVTGLSRRHIQMVLRALLAASIIAKEDTGAGRHANRYHLLLTAGNDAP
jgi:DNA-binding transcriptional regulator GbsR (MarR family)